jgi:superfamily I DNA/RNA helicase
MSEAPMSFAPTPEQQAAIDAFRAGGNMTLEAGAGTGKTSTLKLLAAARPYERGLYLAFNKSVATEAQASFPKGVKCSTVHALAYRAIMAGDAAKKARMGGARQFGKEQARILGITNGKTPITDDVFLAPNHVARLALETVTRFCYSGDDKIEFKHLAQQNGITSYEDRRRLAQIILPLAERAWRDLTSPTGRLKYGHDHYVKEWALTRPQIGAAYIFVDEAQDTNGVVTRVVQDQRGAQVVAVGDRCQSIYRWRGAENAMDSFNSVHHLFLSQSFRFGPAIADEANKWLTLLDADLRITGTPTIASTVGHLDAPDAILCRTNAEAVAQLMKAEDAGRRAALVGGGQDFKRLAEAADQLRFEGWTPHPELAAFTSWGQVQEYVEQDHGGADLATAVKLIDTHGSGAIIRAIDGAVPEYVADLVISTAHKAKGREWHKVQIATDFTEPVNKETGEVGGPIPEEDAMLAYVSVTRAQHALDRDGLAWVDAAVQRLTTGTRIPSLPAPAKSAEVITLRPAQPKKVCGYPHWGMLGINCELDSHGTDTDHWHPEADWFTDNPPITVNA